MFFFPTTTKRVLEFFNACWRVGLITGYKPNLDLFKKKYSNTMSSKTSGIIIYIKFGRYKHDSA